MHAFLEPDDLMCLRLLRDKVLKMLLSSEVPGTLSHLRLVGILRDIRDAAKNKSIWNDAIRSAESVVGVSRNHSIDTISNAIKVMLEDYLDPVEEAPSPQVDAHLLDPVEEPATSQVDERLLDELEKLRAQLTESECLLSELRDVKETTSGALKSKQAELDLALSQLNAATSKFARTDGSLQACQSALKSKQAELDVALAKLEARTDHTTPQELQACQFALKSKQAELDEVLAKLDAKQAKLDEALAKADTYIAQIQTLEVLKSDAEAELTRLRRGSGFLDTAHEGGLGTQDSSRQHTARSSRAPTVSVHGMPAPRRGKKTTNSQSQCQQQ